MGRIAIPFVYLVDRFRTNSTSRITHRNDRIRQRRAAPLYDKRPHGTEQMLKPCAVEHPNRDGGQQLARLDELSDSLREAFDWIILSIAEDDNCRVAIPLLEHCRAEADRRAKMTFP